MSHFFIKMYYLVRAVEFSPFCGYLNHEMKRGIILGVSCRFKRMLHAAAEAYPEPGADCRLHGGSLPYKHWRSRIITKIVAVLINKVNKIKKRIMLYNEIDIPKMVSFSIIFSIDHKIHLKSLLKNHFM